MPPAVYFTSHMSLGRSNFHESWRYTQIFHLSIARLFCYPENTRHIQLLLHLHTLFIKSRLRHHHPIYIWPVTPLHTNLNLITPLLQIHMNHTRRRIPSSMRQKRYPLRLPINANIRDPLPIITIQMLKPERGPQIRGTLHVSQNHRAARRATQIPSCVATRAC
jgi:hypothetical protein